MTELAALLAREHWKVENSLHWRLDVLMKEAAINLSVMRRITLNVLKAHQPFPGKRGTGSPSAPGSMSPPSAAIYLGSLIESTPQTT